MPAPIKVKPSTSAATTIPGSRADASTLGVSGRDWPWVFARDAGARAGEAVAFLVRPAVDGDEAGLFTLAAACEAPFGFLVGALGGGDERAGVFGLADARWDSMGFFTPPAGGAAPSRCFLAVTGRTLASARARAKSAQWPNRSAGSLANAVVRRESRAWSSGLVSATAGGAALRWRLMNTAGLECGKSCEAVRRW